VKTHEEAIEKLFLTEEKGGAAVNASPERFRAWYIKVPQSREGVF